MRRTTETATPGTSTVLLLADDARELGRLGDLLGRVGARNIYRCETAEEAQQALACIRFDLIVAASDGSNPAHMAFVQWVRQAAPEVNRRPPVLVLMTRPQRIDVCEARDSGADLVCARTLPPYRLLHRIRRLKADRRQFVETASYCGPDRRFRSPAAGPGARRRRQDVATLPLAAGQSA